MLHVYNSLTRQKEVFRPLTPGKVGIYACGITVYDYFHIGNARMMVVFDMIVRYLRASNYDVTYVRNITDIDDKIIARAQENNEEFSAVTARFIRAMHEDLNALGVLPPDIEPRATESITAIIDMIQALIANGYAYVAGSGDVLYDVSQFANYGHLANKKLEDLRAGSRVEINAAKDDPLDFVLWKKAKPQEPSWPSPWGDGRPGWHIECSAMATQHLGDHFDIHGGGMDLKFPHHENEIAQAEAATGKTFANYWLHNGFVEIDETKMSKSLGNFFTARDVLQRYAAEVIRLFFLNSHYRQPLNYSKASLDSAKASLSRLYTALRGLPTVDSPADSDYQTRFHTSMDDDFNTPEALAVLFELSHQINRKRDKQPEHAAQLAATLRHLGQILGLLEQQPDAFLQSGAVPSQDPQLSHNAIEQLIAERNTARRNKDWAEADRIRDQLQDGGIILEDSADGTIWRRG